MGSHFAGRVAITRVGRAAVGGYRWGGDARPPEGMRRAARLIQALIVVLASTGIAVARMGPPATVSVPLGAVTGGAPNADATTLKTAAADLLAALISRIPHYHRRGPGGMDRHRPWVPGERFWDRF